MWLWILEAHNLLNQIALTIWSTIAATHELKRKNDDNDVVEKRIAMIQMENKREVKNKKEMKNYIIEF